MKKICIVFYALAVIALVTSFWVSSPYRMIGFICLLIASVVGLIDYYHKKKKTS